MTFTRSGTPDIVLYEDPDVLAAVRRIWFCSGLGLLALFGVDNWTEHFRTDNGRVAALKACGMGDQRKDFSSKIDLEIEASMALEQARAMPSGSERAQALKEAGTLQNAALSQCISFNKRGRPAKT